MECYKDPSQPIEKRVDDLVSRMTLKEKISQTLNDAPDIPHLGIDEYEWWNECLHGVGRAGRATVFPQAIGLAATFNTDLLFRVATAISDEARAKHHDALRMDNHCRYVGLTYWTPNINIFRDPRWGRGQETYGEDPYLTGELGLAFVRGLQGDDPTYLKLVATPKHFAVHSGPEKLRHQFDAVVNKRDLWETYLPAFRKCVVEGKAASVMGAYNRTNGEPCCASQTLLKEILREKWGFDGFVVSDCRAIQDIHEFHKVTNTPAESAALAIKNGCELNCGRMYVHLQEAVEQGLLTEEDIDIAVKRLMTARFRLGMFDPPEKVPFSRIPVSVVNCEDHRKLALQAARESIVLLKNANNALPLSPDIRRLAVVGPGAASVEMLWSNYNGYSPHMTSILEGITGKIAAGTQMEFFSGWDDNNLPPDEAVPQFGNLKAFDRIIAVLGTTNRFEGECVDRESLSLPKSQPALLQSLKNTGVPVVLVVTGGSPVDLSWAHEHLDAIVFVWYPGQAGGEAVADALFGDYNPAGRLPVAFPKSIDQLPDFEDYSMNERTYRFMQTEPLYRFGYGLSYSSFTYSNLQVPRSPLEGNKPFEISVTLTNEGPRAGEEVVQVYVSDIESSVPVPILHLEGYRRVYLENGASMEVRFTITPEQLAAFDENGTPFVEPGTFRISVGGGHPDDPTAGAISGEIVVG